MIKTYLKHLVLNAEKNYLKNLYEGVRGISADKFLDIGCYYGENTVKIAGIVNAKKMSGIELNEKAIMVAKKRGISIVRQDVSQKKWKIKDNSFDFVYSNQVIEHLYSVDNFVDNIKRILKMGGHALISTENLAGWHNVFSLALGYQPFSYTNISTKKWNTGNPLSINKDGHHDPLMIHRAVFTYYALREFLINYNFEIVKPITSSYYPLPHLIGNMLAKIDRRHAVYIAFLIKNRK